MTTPKQERTPSSQRSWWPWLLGLGAVLLFVVWAVLGHQPIQPPQALKGRLDLSAWPIAQKGGVKLNGKWSFYHSRLLGPSTIKKGCPSQGRRWFWLPGMRNAYVSDDGTKLNAFGYDTFCLEVKLSAHTSSLPLAVRSPNQRTANQLWVLTKKGQLLLGPLKNGEVGTNAQTHRPSIRITSGDFVVPANVKEIVLLLQVSNFSHSKAGPMRALLLGTPEVVKTLILHTNQISFFVIGMIAFMAIYQLIFFLFRTKETASLWFFLVCLVMLLRVSLTDNHLYTFANSTAAWSFLMKVEYLTVLFIIYLLLMFVHALSGSPMRRVFHLLFGLPTGVFLLLVLATPVAYFTSIYIYYYPVLFFAVIYGTSLIVGEYLRTGDRVPLLTLVGLVVGAFVVIYELLMVQRVVAYVHIGKYGIVIFAVFQAMTIAIYNQRARYAAEVLAARLELQSIAARRFVPHSFLELLGKESLVEIQLGDHTQRNMSILFSDIRSFTVLSESMAPRDNFTFINEYLSYMDVVVQENKGFIDKYIGDAVMALFDGDSENAVKAGKGMLRALRIFNQRRQEQGMPPIRIGVGINSGEVMLGTIGGRYRMDGTVISDAVNLASRIEGMTKVYGVPLLITEHTYKNLSDPESFCIREIDCVVVKGKQIPVTVYEVFDEDDEPLREAKLRSKETFERGVALFQEHKEGRVEEALRCFEQCQEELPQGAEDLALAFYIARCRGQSGPSHEEQG